RRRPAPARPRPSTDRPRRGRRRPRALAPPGSRPPPRARARARRRRRAAPAAARAATSTRGETRRSAHSSRRRRRPPRGARRAGRVRARRARAPSRGRCSRRRRSPRRRTQSLRAAAPASPAAPRRARGRAPDASGDPTRLGRSGTRNSRAMFDHVTIRVSDGPASERFYRTVLGAMGLEPTYAGDAGLEWDDFSLGEGTPVTRGLHLGFRAPSRAQVDAFWRAGVEAGFEDDGEPGPRPVYGDDYYGAFLRDPDGNSAEAVHHGGIAGTGTIDHLWIRVADVAVSGAFYDLVGEIAGFPAGRERPDAGPELPHRMFYGFDGGGSFSLVAGGTPTEHVHLAFP